MMPMLSQSGQESATFELLVAVVIMGFVIFVGLQAMERLKVEQCFATIEKSLEEFKTKLEIAVTQKSPQTIPFILSHCFNPEQEKVRVQDWDNALFCADLCGTAEITCTSLEYFNERPGSISAIRKCLNISPETIFPGQTTPGRCTSIDTESPRQTYILQDFKQNAPQGTYLIINKTFATDTFPTICSYLRV